MARKKSETAANPVVKAAECTPVFEIKMLRRDCMRLFGITASTFDGAFFGADTNKKFTLDEAKQQIEAWGKKEAK